MYIKEISNDNQFPKYGLRLKLLQIGPAKKAFNAGKKNQNVSLQEDKEEKKTWTELESLTCSIKSIFRCNRVYKKV